MPEDRSFLDVDFVLPDGRNVSLFFSAVAWDPKNPAKGQCIGVWDDKDIRDMLGDQMELALVRSKRPTRKRASKWIRKFLNEAVFTLIKREIHPVVRGLPGVAQVSGRELEFRLPIDG